MQLTRGVWQMSLAMIISGSIGAFVLLSGLPVTDVVFWRCLIGALTLLVFIVLSRQPFSRLTRFTLALAVIGGAALVVNWLLLFAAYSRISIGMATVVYNTQPFMLVLMGMVLGERVSAVKWGWLLLAFGGVVILLSSELTPAHEEGLTTGVLLALGAAFFYALTAIIARKLHPLPAQHIAFIQVLVGVVMLLSASGDARVLTLFGMSVGTSVAVINYISRIFAPIESLGMEVQTIQSAMAGVKRIDAFLAQPEREISAQRTRAARGDVELSHVTFGYGEKHVLNDFSMTVKQGEQVTLIGRTGAGKSTVFKLLLGLYPAESGTVTIGGVPVADITDRERRTCISCVEQHFARVPGTVLDQITLGDPQITAEMAKHAAQLAGIDGAIEALPDGYDTPCSEGMFSQGEWQLLSIARAAAADPAVLLLDEITANLDAETEARVLEALRRASEGRTVLSVSHRIYENLGGRTVEIKIL